MTVKSGFFNSVNQDRLYDAKDINRFFDGIITDGVFAGVGGWLEVVPDTGLAISVAVGKAWFLQSYIFNTQDLALALDPADVAVDRIDTVILDFDSIGRQNTISILPGTPAATPSPPSLIDTSTRKQVPLADIYVAANATIVNDIDITLHIGTDLCPFVTGLIQQVSITDLLNKWDAEMGLWRDSWETTITQLDTTGTLAELVAIRDRPLRGRNMIINGDFRVSLRNGPNITSVSGQDYNANISDLYPLVDRWRFELGSPTSGTWTLSTENVDNERKRLRLTCTSTASLSNSADKIAIAQCIEGANCGNINKGTADAKPMVLTWEMKSNKNGTFIAELYQESNPHIISSSFSHPGDDSVQKFEWIIPASTDSSHKIDLDETAGIWVRFWFGAGSGYKSGASLLTSWNNPDDLRRAVGVANLGDIANRYAEIGVVQLEVGDIATDYEYVPIDEAIAACKRYCEYYNGLAVHVSTLWTGFVGTDIRHSGPLTWQIRKRVPPIITYYDCIDKRAAIGLEANNVEDNDNLPTNPNSFIYSLNPTGTAFPTTYYDFREHTWFQIDSLDPVDVASPYYIIHNWLYFQGLRIDAEFYT